MLDSHCHLTHPRFAADVDEVVRRALASGVSACVTIGTGVEDAGNARALARTRPGSIFATGGLDPFSSHAAGTRFDDAFRSLADLLEEGGFVAVGEIGLDYHHDLDARSVQRDRLERQLVLARTLELPVVLHVREAHDDMAAVLASHPGLEGVVHSFTAGPAEAERYLALGWKLAFNGVVTFRNAGAVKEAAALAPRDAILVETDAPYLAPVPHRGKRCEPAFVAETVRALAALRREDPERLGATVERNARELFRLGPS